VRLINLIFCLFFFSCTQLKKTTQSREGIQTYSYTDVSGRYLYSRELKKEKNKLITRTILGVDQAGQTKVLEKSITVSQLGTIKVGSKREIVSRPIASDFEVWLEGKKYFSKIRMLEKEKKLLVELDSPEAKWKGTSTYLFPKKKYFCFFSQIPDCLNHSFLLKRALDKKDKGFSFVIVWDNYPYVQDQFTGVAQTPFSSAILKFEGSEKKKLKYIVEVDGQTVLYHFSPSFDLMRILWIAQGLTVVPPGEEINSSDD
jgi:hypothetical protein